MADQNGQRSQLSWAIALTEWMNGGPGNWLESSWNVILFGAIHARQKEQKQLNYCYEALICINI